MGKDLETDENNKAYEKVGDEEKIGEEKVGEDQEVSKEKVGEGQEASEEKGGEGQEVKKEKVREDQGVSKEKDGEGREAEKKKTEKDKENKRKAAKSRMKAAKENRRRKSKEREERYFKKNKNSRVNWEKLDNTANLFPAIASNNMTNVYRISVTLTENIKRGNLQQALDDILPKFDNFRVQMRQGLFWNYFETNKQSPPVVEMENEYPCAFIDPNRNHGYLFRVTYYRNRINLEVFHVLPDGMGGINFLRELTYQYLRLSHPSEFDVNNIRLSEGTTVNTEDSYLKNYKEAHAKGYKTERAVEIKGEKLPGSMLGVIHGYVPIGALKEVCHRRNVSINEYMTALLTYSIYKEYLHERTSKRPIAIAVPVNLRPYFESITTRNFFVMISSIFKPVEETYTYDQVEKIVVESLRGQMNKEHLEHLFSYNVSNQRNIILRSVPMPIKVFAMRMVYKSSARANTTTISNIGNIKIKDEFKPFVERFHAMISRSEGQNMKLLLCSYGDELVLNFTSGYRDVSIQRRLFKMLADEGLDVRIESNGVYYG